ncbi:MAG TPA: hypothetical protein VFI13_08440, partial [Gemmatimonadales bacterium]|nr:hypothetical protein [Gemmatimonadales bacterium]
HPWTKVTVAVEGDTTELEVGDVDARTRIVWGITEGVRRALGRALDPALLDWAGGVPIPRGSLTLPELRAARRALALSPSSVAHECLRGDAAACGAILDVDGPAASLDRWYLAADLPLLARSSEGLRARSTAWQRCAWAGDAALCRSLLVDLPRAGLPFAIPRTSRDDLLRFALARGGDEALPRLIAARGRPIADQLAAAAGSSWPELRSAWTGAVSGGSGQRDPATFFLASGWTVALLGASAWRFRRRAA